MSNCDLVAWRSLIGLAASRLALRAPALRAAFHQTAFVYHPTETGGGFIAFGNNVPKSEISFTVGSGGFATYRLLNNRLGAVKANRRR